MKNYWLQQRTERLEKARLEQKQQVERERRAELMDEFDELCHRYNAGFRWPWETGEKLNEIFTLLAESIVMAFSFGFIHKEDAIQEAVLVAWEKIHRFCPKDPKHERTAFNFFTTIMLSHLRAVYRSQSKVDKSAQDGNI